MDEDEVLVTKLIGFAMEYDVEELSRIRPDRYRIRHIFYLYQ